MRVLNVVYFSHFDATKVSLAMSLTIILFIFISSNFVSYKE